jgi:hypothetical protein
VSTRCFSSPAGVEQRFGRPVLAATAVAILTAVNMAAGSLVVILLGVPAYWLSERGRHRFHKQRSLPGSPEERVDLTSW